jgi:stringent starvation protein B
MTSNKPYLIRALYEWLVDNDATPHIMVDASNPQVDIPAGIAKDDRVVLNVAARALQGLEMTNSHITFSARFSGRSHQVFIPMAAIMAIYSMEDGEGMMFADGDGAEEQQESLSKEGGKAAGPKNKPGLTVVK